MNELAPTKDVESDDQVDDASSCTITTSSAFSAGNFIFDLKISVAIGSKISKKTKTLKRKVSKNFIDDLHQELRSIIMSHFSSINSAEARDELQRTAVAVRGNMTFLIYI
jgi:hypothetical protein